MPNSYESNIEYCYMSNLIYYFLYVLFKEYFEFLKK